MTGGTGSVNSSVIGDPVVLAAVMLSVNVVVPCSVMVQLRWMTKPFALYWGAKV